MLALEGLRGYIDRGGDPSRVPFAIAATETLRWSVKHPDGYHSSSYILSRLMQFDKSLSTTFYGVLIDNAVDAGDMDTALSVFRLIQENNVQPTRRMVGSLMKGLRTLNDQAVVDEIMQLGSTMAQELQDDWIAVEILYWHHFRHRERILGMKVERSVRRLMFCDAYQSLFQTYLHFFDPLPLIHLDIVPSDHNLIPMDRMPPSAAAIRVMLAAYLETPGPDGGAQMYRTYNNWWDIIARGKCSTTPWINDLMVELAMQPHTANIFISKIGACLEYLPRCTEVVRDMSITLPDDIMPRNPVTDEPLSIAAPNLVTWNILLHAFARHGQTVAAERVFELLQKKDFTPDVSTWTSLIKGYAMKQDIGGLVKALGRMEKSGCEHNQYTRRALSRFKNQHLLHCTLRRKLAGMGRERPRTTSRYGPVDHSIPGKGSADRMMQDAEGEQQVIRSSSSAPSDQSAQPHQDTSWPESQYLQDDSSAFVDHELQKQLLENADQGDEGEVDWQPVPHSNSEGVELGVLDPSTKKGE